MRWREVLMLAALLGAGASVGLVPGSAAGIAATDPELGAGESLDAWVLLGTGRGGRELILGGVRNVPNCRTRRVDLLEQTADTVRIRLVRIPKPGAGREECPTEAVDKPFDIIRLPLHEPLTGQRIDGPQQYQPGKALVNSIPGDDGGARTRPVTGLAVHDAIATLVLFGERRSHISVRGPRSGYVIRQRPRLPRDLKRSKPTTLFTRRTPGQ